MRFPQLSSERERDHLIFWQKIGLGRKCHAHLKNKTKQNIWHHINNSFQFFWSKTLSLKEEIQMKDTLSTYLYLHQKRIIWIIICSFNLLMKFTFFYLTLLSFKGLNLISIARFVWLYHYRAGVQVSGWECELIGNVWLSLMQ